MADLELERTSGGGETVITVRGEIDMATAPQLRDLLDDLSRRAPNASCSTVASSTFLDSSGIGVLIAARNRLGDDGAIVLDSPPAHVRKVLEITGVSSHLSVVP